MNFQVGCNVKPELIFTKTKKDSFFVVVNLITFEYFLQIEMNLLKIFFSLLIFAGFFVYRLRLSEKTCKFRLKDGDEYQKS